jgi:hypothetical protein
VISPKRHTTIPKAAFLQARLKVGDRMRVRAEADSRVVFERIDQPTAA